MEERQVAVRLREIAAELATLESCAGDAERIDVIAGFDQVQAVASAAQQVVMVEFANSQIRAQADAGVPAARQGRGVAEQIAYARKVSPTAAARQLSAARTLLTQLPKTYGLLAVGAISAWVAAIVVRETECLRQPEQSKADELLAPVLATLSPRQVEAATRRTCIELDQSSVVRRRAKAKEDRRVWIRPAPDTMAVVSALLPVEQGVACWANLTKTANAVRADGDPRSLDQIRADTFVQRLTGQHTADAVPVTIGLTMSAGSLLDGDDDTAAVLDGYGPVSAALARDLATRADVNRAKTFIRRLFTDPVDNTIFAVDPHARLFSGPLARFIRARDQHCRDPYCTAPIRDIDHARPHAAGGPTTAGNGEGRCQRGNLVKEMPGWQVTPAGPDKISIITTPTGHRYRSAPPPALGHGGIVQPAPRGSRSRSRSGTRRQRSPNDAVATGREPPDE